MEDRCVCCGNIVPEGRMVCRLCELQEEDNGSTASTNEVNI